MPGQPVYKMIDTGVARRHGVRASTPTAWSIRRLSFVAQTALYPADVDVRQPQAQPAIGARRSRATARRRPLGPASIGATVQGAPAAESTGPSRAATCCASSSVLKGRRFVSLAYLAPADALRTPEAERFFQSLRLGS